jgi:hypothetical protein
MKSGYLWFCTDYKKLDDVTRKDCFPLPQINDTLDIKSGYWQVDLHLDNKKTAFSTKDIQLCPLAYKIFHRCLNS